MISIIVPVYNTSLYLKRCIESILNQTYYDFELLLIDDGSTDDSLSICRQYEDKDKRVKVLHKENGGQGSARNLGLDIAQGDYIAFIDSDDFIPPQYYEVLLKLLQDFNADIVCCHYQFIQPGEECKFEALDYDDIKCNAQLINTQDFLQNFDKYFKAVSWISPCTKLCKKEVYKDTRYPEGVIDEDSYILHHFIGNSRKIVRIEDKLYYYVWSPNSTSRSEFSPKRFDKNGANLDRVKFFHDRCIKTQEDFFKREYLINTLKMYYTVSNEHPQFLKDFKQHKKEYHKNVLCFVKNNERICNMEKVIYTLFDIAPILAEILYNKYLK